MTTKAQIQRLEGISAEALALLPKKAIRVIDENLGDIDADATIDSRTARKVRKEILEVIENAALRYCGKYRQVPTAYLSSQLLKEAEEFVDFERYDIASHLENLGDQLSEVRGSRIK